MRIMFHANAPWVGSGYGQSIYLFARELQGMGHDVAFSTYLSLHGSVIEWNGITVYPGGANRYATDIGVRHAIDWGADVLVPVLDAWVLAPLVAQARAANLPVALWAPVDQAPVPKAVLEVGRMADRFLCYSKWGTDGLLRSGIDAAHVPLGVDLDLFYPSPKAPAAARSALGLGEDVFTAGIIASNQCPYARKAWPQQLEGFAMFHDVHPASQLYIHANPTPPPGGGYNLLDLVQEYGIEDCVVFVDDYKNHIGIPAAEMRRIYNALDVLLAASAGEGFGLPILEAQACGTPVITGHWTSMSELHWNGVQIDRAMRWRTPQGGYWFYPEPRAVADALGALYGPRVALNRRQPAEVRNYSIRWLAPRLVGELERLLPAGPLTVTA